MRFGLVHRIMTDALAALGVIALVLSGQFSRWVSGVLIAGLILALVLSLKENWQRHPALRHADTVALLAVLGIQGVRVLFDANVLDVLVEFAAALQIIRLATRKGAAHDQQVIVLALLHLIAGTVLGGGLGYGLCFLGVLVVAPSALVLSHLRREVEGNYRQGARDRTGLPVDVPRILRSRRVVGKTFLAVTCLLSIPILLFTAVLFVIFPRVGLSLLFFSRGHAGRMIGFSNRVDLGEVGVLRSDPTLAMRIEVPGIVEPPPPRLTLHLRGTALDAYDGRTWTQSDPGAKRPAETEFGLIPFENSPDPQRDPLMRIDLEPIDPPVVFLPQNASGMRVRPRGQIGTDFMTMIYKGSEGEYRYQPLDDRGLKYEIFVSSKGAVSFRDLPSAERARYLALPPDLPARVRDLAKEWTAGQTTPLGKAVEIERRLRTGFVYDLASPSGKDKQPLDHFLFESKRGHCEFYSSAMAILLRAADVPTRNVTGFIGGTWNRFGRFYAVRQGDAHSWVEAFVDGEGWRTFDPTPPADAAPKSELSGAWAQLRDFLEATSQRWDRHVVGYDLSQQASLWREISKRRQRTGSIFGENGIGKRTGFAAFGIAAAGAAAYILYKRRKQRGSALKPEEQESRSPSAALATVLYEALDSVMAAIGVGRSPGVPPLRHARALEMNDHPAADEILDLTNIYLFARFGGVSLSEEDRLEFEQRVKLLKQTEERRIKRQSARDKKGEAEADAS
jgi:transglutaminase-like putative cysteine protease